MDKLVDNLNQYLKDGKLDEIKKECQKVVDGEYMKSYVLDITSGAYSGGMKEDLECIVYAYTREDAWKKILGTIQKSSEWTHILFSTEESLKFIVDDNGIKFMIAGPLIYMLPRDLILLYGLVQQTGHLDIHR